MELGGTGFPKHPGEAMTIRKSHQSPAVQKLYEEFLGQPLSHKCHDVLHTYYTPSERRTMNCTGDERNKVNVK